MLPYIPATMVQTMHRQHIKDSLRAAGQIVDDRETTWFAEQTPFVDPLGAAALRIDPRPVRAAVAAWFERLSSLPAKLVGRGAEA